MALTVFGYFDRQESPFYRLGHYYDSLDGLADA